MKNKIKYLIISILLISAGIMFSTTYYEINIHNKTYKDNIKSIEALGIENYKKSMKKKIKLTILYIDSILENVIISKEHLLIYEEERIRELSGNKRDLETFVKNYQHKEFILKEEILKEKPFVSTMINIKDKKLTLYIKNETIKNIVLKEIKKILYLIDEKDKRYIWINEVLDYKGGKDYAIRVLHGNLKNTEGKKLSTFDKDFAGQKPYLKELNGIKSNGEVLFTYFFKELNSEIISEKISYAKLYPKLDWIVATGIPLNKLQSIIKKKQEILEKEYISHFKKVIILNSFTLILLFTLLIYLYKKISKYTKEKIVLEKEILENKINKKYQRELEKREEQYSYLTEATQDGVWDWNLLTNEVYYSSSFKLMLGYEDNEFPCIYKSWHERIHPDDKEMVNNEVEANLSGKSEFYSVKYRLQHKDNTWIWVDDKGKVFFNESGKAVRMVGSHRDITKEKYYYELMLKKEKQFSQLFYNNKLKAADSVKSATLFQSNGNTAPMEFIDTAGCGFNEVLNEEWQSRYNPDEYQILREHLYQLVAAADKDNFPSIGIISPYRQQVIHIKSDIETDPTLEGSSFDVNTIDGFWKYSDNRAATIPTTPLCQSL